MVLGAIAKKLMSADVVTMTNTLSAMASYVTTDMEVTDIISVATSMRGIDVDNDIWSAMNPTYASYENNIWYEYSDNNAWRKMMERVDAGLPPYEDEERNTNNGGTLDGTVTGVQETGGLLSGSSASSGGSSYGGYDSATGSGYGSGYNSGYESGSYGSGYDGSYGSDYGSSNSSTYDYDYGTSGAGSAYGADGLSSGGADAYDGASGSTSGAY